VAKLRDEGNAARKGKTRADRKKSTLQIIEASEGQLALQKLKQERLFPCFKN
jgi:hypothetical protein